MKTLLKTNLPNIYDMIDFEKSEKELNITRAEIDLLSRWSHKKIWFNCECGTKKISGPYYFSLYPKCNKCFR